MKRCPKCGTGYPDSDSFCMECGSGLEKVVAGPRTPPVKKAMKVPKVMGADVSRLEGKLRVLEDEVGRLSSETRGLKAAMPKDLELLRSGMEGTAGRVSDLNSRIREMSRKLGENEKHAAGIENIVAGLPRRQEIEKLSEDIAARFAGKAIEDNERFECMEAEIRGELSNLSAGFTRGLKSRLDSATRRVERLEANLTNLIKGLENMVGKRLEGFKTGFNQKVNKSILELRREVEEKTSIISRLRENLEQQIKLNEERYAGFESRVKRELEDIDSFKEGLSVQQDARMKEFRTELLERLGEVKKLEEDLALQQQKRILVMEDRLNRALEGLGREALPGQGKPRGAGPDSGELLKLRRELEDAVKGIKRLEEDLIIQQESRLIALDSRIGEALGKLRPGEGTNINPKGEKYNRL